MENNGRRRRLWLFSGIALAAVGAGAYGFYWLRRPALPRGFASANGRIEATQYDIATKRAGRIVEVRVREGDLVEKGQVLAQMDIDELEAQRREAEARVHVAENQKKQAEATVAERLSDRTLASQELARREALTPLGAATVEELDQKRSRLKVAQAAYDTAVSGVLAADAAVVAAEAKLQRIRTLLDESTLVSPIRGRVIYRLAEPGEVLSAGGKVVTVLDLADVYMTIFLPTEQAGRVAYGAEARMVLDAFPGLVIPATISFASPEAQFTPKEVETRTEREKLMFRFKVKIDQKLLEEHLEQVKTGVPGVSDVRLVDAGEWPAYLAVKLPPS